MFKIDAQSLPFVQTRSALLVLDLQIDFVGPEAILPVRNPTGFLDKIVQLVPDFRATGHVIWIRSVFQDSRPVNEPYGESESVVTDAELNLENRGDDDTRGRSGLNSTKLQNASKEEPESNRKAVETNLTPALDEDGDDGEDGDPVMETFLTVEPGKHPQVVLAMSSETNFVQQALEAVDVKKDLIFQKTWYSAFRDGSLVQILRAKFVTEIFICGVLTNISVFATAMDAARHGYSITIIDDCLGYRSKAKHDEALRRLVEFTGCEIVSSDVLAKELQAKAKKRPPPPNSQQRPGPRGQNYTLDDLMSSLNLRKGKSAERSRETSATVASPLIGAESSGSSRRAKSNDSEDLQLPSRSVEGEPKKRDRVRQKIRTRRRPSNPSQPSSKETGAAGTSSEKSLPSAVATLSAAAKSLEDLPKPATSTRDMAANSEEAEAPGPPLKDLQAEELEMANLTASMGAIAVRSDQVVEPESSSKDGSPILCEGDTTIIKNLLNDEFAEDIYEQIRDEVRWQKMSHQGGEVPRLVAVQGSISGDGSIPVYRHPADESPPLLPFSSKVLLIRKQVEKHLGHEVNHVLIQMYRNGSDYISEHSDKTLDIVPNTFIANVSLGAQRTMVFRTKRHKGSETTAADVAEPRQTMRAGLPHNSMCKMGLVTNKRWLHGIRQDKRLASEKMAEELAYQGGRISLTFRLIGTYLDKDQAKIWGQGAVAKTRDEARSVINGNTSQAELMIRAFGKENQSTDFDWNAVYGDGFDVLHLSNTRKLFLSADSIANLRVKLYLAEHNIEWSEANLSPAFTWKDGDSNHGAPEIPESLPIKFVDNDLSKTTVVGDLAILLYLDAIYGCKTYPTPRPQVDMGKQFTRLQQSVSLVKKWRAQPFNVKPFQQELKIWEAYALEAPYIAGSTISVADFALFAIIEEIRHEWKNAEGVHNVVAWYFRIRYRESVMKVMGELDESARQREAALNSYPGVKNWEDESE